MYHSNTIKSVSIILVLFLTFSGMVKQNVNAQSLEADSLCSTINKLPVEEQVTQLLDYAKNYQYSNPEMSAELVEHSLELAESIGDPVVI